MLSFIPNHLKFCTKEILCHKRVFFSRNYFRKNILLLIPNMTGWGRDLEVNQLIVAFKGD